MNKKSFASRLIAAPYLVWSAIFIIVPLFIVAYFAFASFPIMSMRLSELYGIVEIVTFPCLIFTISPKIVGRLFVCIIALIELIYNLAINQLLNFDA